MRDAEGLTPDQIKQIAALKYEPGYMLLMDYLQAEVDNLADEMAAARSAQEVLQTARVWQVARNFLHQLRTKPEEAERVFEEEKMKETERIGPPANVDPQLAAYLKSLQDPALRGPWEAAFEQLRKL